MAGIRQGMISHIVLVTGEKVYLDSDRDTYLYASADDTPKLIVGGLEALGVSDGVLTVASGVVATDGDIETDGSVYGGYRVYSAGNIYTNSGNIYSNTGDVNTNTGDVYTSTGDLRTNTGNVTATAGTVTAVSGTFNTLKLNGATTGAIYYSSDADVLTELTPGVNGQFLTTQGAGANPAWTSVSVSSAPSTSSGIANEALTAGNIAAFYNGATGTVVKAGANALGTAKRARGYIQSSVSAGAMATILTAAETTVADALWDVKPTASDIGLSVWMSETPGNSTLTVPTASGYVCLEVGTISYADASANTTRVSIDLGMPITLASG